MASTSVSGVSAAYFPLSSSTFQPSSLHVQQTITNAEWPPLATSNVGFTSDYTDLVSSIDLSAASSNQEFPPVNLTGTSTTVTINDASYGLGTYTVTASTGSSASRVFNKGSSSTASWTSAPSTYTASTGAYAGSVQTVTTTNSSNAGEYIQLQLPVDVILNSYSLLASSSSTEATKQMPTTFKIFGSTTGTDGSWTELNSQSGLTWSASETKTIGVVPGAFYRYFRLVANVIGNTGQSSGRDPLAINEWRLYATYVPQYPKWRATLSLNSATDLYGVGNYSVFANTQSATSTPEGLVDKLYGAAAMSGTSNQVWVSFSNAYTSTADADAASVPSVYIQLPTPIYLTGYSVAGRSNYETEVPSKWDIYGSNTTSAAAWTLLEQRSAAASATAQLQTFTAPATSSSLTTAYDSYRFDFKRNNSVTGASISLAELILKGTKTSAESRLYIAADGRVGIGTNVLDGTNTLIINGNSAFNANVGIGTIVARGKVDIVHTNATTPALVVDQDGTGDIMQIRDTGTSKVVVNTVGNVGIGTTNPLSSLHVNGDTTMSRLGTGINQISLVKNTVYYGPAFIVGYANFSDTTSHKNVYATIGSGQTSFTRAIARQRVATYYMDLPISLYVPPGYWANITTDATVDIVGDVIYCY